MFLKKIKLHSHYQNVLFFSCLNKESKKKSKKKCLNEINVFFYFGHFRNPQKHKIIRMLHLSFKSHDVHY